MFEATRQTRSKGRGQSRSVYPTERKEGGFIFEDPDISGKKVGGYSKSDIFGKRAIYKP